MNPPLLELLYDRVVHLLTQQVQQMHVGILRGLHTLQIKRVRTVTIGGGRTVTIGGGGGGVRTVTIGGGVRTLKSIITLCVFDQSTLRRTFTPLNYSIFPIRQSTSVADGPVMRSKDDPSVTSYEENIITGPSSCDLPCETCSAIIKHCVISEV